jgi:general stress protein 26
MTDTDDLRDREHLWSLIRDIRFAMFTTHHPNGHLHARPMTTQNSRLDEDNSLWFFMSRGDDAVGDLATDACVCVSYADPDTDAYVSVSGSASVVDDTSTKRRLWSKTTEAWFPDGPDDPNLALVRVAITHADYWDVRENKLVQLFKMARSAVTGRPPQGMGEHGRVRMR